MNNVYLSHNNIVSSYGFDSNATIDQISNETTSVVLNNDLSVLPKPFYASRINQEALEKKYALLNSEEKHTLLEKMMLVSLADIISKSGVELNPRVGLIVSTTKGNIDVLDKNSSFLKERAYLSSLGKKIGDFFDFKNEAIVVSNACVSGVLAIATAKRFINHKNRHKYWRSRHKCFGNER